jgi:VIT1/CCC1 family predicted Fe2+/Mn2+ transporter
MREINFVEEQRNEINNYKIYSYLSKKFKGKNSKIFNEIALAEKKHYGFWKTFTKKEVKPNFLLVFFYSLIFRLLGLTFAVKFMEKKEKQIEERNKKFYSKLPNIKLLIKDEAKHEKQLISLLNEERVKYISAVILGLNDALVEITGTLAGLSLALPKASLVGLSGLITGVAASLSMAASGYLSVKAEKNKNPLKASIYTGVTYIIAVIFLVLPFFIFNNVYVALLSTILFVIFAVSLYNLYFSVINGVQFKKQFIEMISICFAVTIITFGIGFLVKTFWGINV